MPETYRSNVIDAPVERVWSVVRQFNGLPAWHPAIAESSLDSGAEGEVGAVRRLTLGDGGIVVERLVALDDERRRLTYAIQESPFAARNYVSTMHLAPVTETNGTFIEWFAVFDCDTADEDQLTALFGDGVFGAGVTALGAHVAS